MEASHALKIADQAYAQLHAKGVEERERALQAQSQRFARGVALLAQYVDVRPRGNDWGVTFFNQFESSVCQMSEDEIVLLVNLGWRAQWEEGGDFERDCWIFEEF